MKPNPMDASVPASKTTGGYVENDGFTQAWDLIERLRRCNDVPVSGEMKRLLNRIYRNLDRVRKRPETASTAVRALSMERLAFDLGTTVPTIRRARNHLVDANLLRIEYTTNNVGGTGLIGYVPMPRELVLDDSVLVKRCASDRKLLAARAKWTLACDAARQSNNAREMSRKKEREENEAIWALRLANPEEEPDDDPGDGLENDLATGGNESFPDGENELLPTGGTTRAGTTRAGLSRAPSDSIAESALQRSATDTGYGSAIEGELGAGRAFEKFRCADCGQSLPWRDARGAQKCMRCHPHADVKLVPQNEAAIKSFMGVFKGGPNV